MPREIKETRAALPLHLAALSYASDMIGVTEDKVDGQFGNWGPKVKEFLKAANVYQPAPWCAAFVNWCAEQGAYDHQVTSPLEEVPNQAYVPSYMDWATETGKFITPHEAGPGDLFALYFESLKRYAHIGFVLEVNPEEGWLDTIEGNSNEEGSREGYQVVSRRRRLVPTTAFIRWD